MQPRKSYSIKIPLHEAKTHQDIIFMVSDGMKQFADHGGKKLKNAALYITPTDENGSPITLTESPKKPLKEIRPDPPYRSAADEHGI